MRGGVRRLRAGFNVKPVSGRCRGSPRGYYEPLPGAGWDLASFGALPAFGLLERDALGLSVVSVTRNQ